MRRHIKRQWDRAVVAISKYARSFGSWVWKHRRQVFVWTALITVCAAIMVGCYWLGRRYGITPYLAGLGAFLAAFLGPVPGIVAPETRGKWLITIIIAAIIGLGVFYSSDDLEKEKDSLEQRLVALKESLKVSLKDLPKDGQDKLFQNTAHRFQQLFTGKTHRSVIDLSDVLLTADPNNGYALEFAGLSSRALGDRSNMRTYFRQYLALAGHHPEATIDDLGICYSAPSGYCRERTDWIAHLMALDSYEEAERNPAGRLDSLAEALRYERQTLADRIKICGFSDREGSVPPSYALLQSVLRAGTGWLAGQVQSLLEEFRVQCGLQKISISPANVTLAVGSKVRLRVAGTYALGSPAAPTADLSTFAVLRSSDVSLADISTSGELSARKAGTANICADVQFSSPGSWSLTDCTVLTVSGTKQ